MDDSMQEIFDELEQQGFIHHFTHSPDGWLFNGEILDDTIEVITRYWCCPYTDQMVYIHAIKVSEEIKGIGVWCRGG